MSSSADDSGYSGYMTSKEPPRGFLLTAPEGTRWRFDPGSLFLEFLLTGGPGELAVFDSLHGPDDLLRWVAQSRLALPADAIKVTRKELSLGRALRDALWRLTSAVLAGDDFGPLDVTLVNHVAARPPLAPQLNSSGSASWLLPSTGMAVLSTVARDALPVLTGAMAGRLRECEAGDCRLVFLDTSRPGSRRWCSMERCGNRHKVRELRIRRAAASPGSTRTPEGA